MVSHLQLGASTFVSTQTNGEAMNPLPQPANAVATLIRPNRCEKCKYSSARPQNDNLECRRFPPTAAHIAERQKNGQLGFITYTGFPIVKPDAGCGEWAPALALQH